MTANTSVTASFAALPPAPQTPTLNNPSNGVTNVSQSNVPFSWSVANASAAQVNSYRIVIAQDSNFTGFTDTGTDTSSCPGACFTTSTGTATSYTKNMDLAGKTYYWKVRANGPGGVSPWSVTRSFTTAGSASFPSVDWSSRAYRGDNIFWTSGNAPSGFYSSSDTVKSKLGSAKGNCTWYAHGRLRQLGYTVSLNSMTGNASTWSASAVNAGISVDTTPTAGSIAQSTANRSIYNSYGHVAVVEKVGSAFNELKCLLSVTFRPLLWKGW